MLRSKIPVSVIVVTKNEVVRIQACLQHLHDFDDVWVVDSGSDDGTTEIAVSCGARVIDYAWDGRYPKKRQWCLAHLELAHDWVFFVDADEVVAGDVLAEIAALFEAGEPDGVGFFVRSHYIWQGKMLRFGLKNTKLVLFDRRRVEFPVVDDLDLPGMGEIEGHYQPVLKDGAEGEIGVLRSFMLHDAGSDVAVWEARHLRYAAWEAGMIKRGAYPKDHGLRQALKVFFRQMPLRGVAAFLHSYVWKFGFLDGLAGFDFARSRMRYYGMVRSVLRASKAEG